jgi:hypothetical protein
MLLIFIFPRLFVSRELGDGTRRFTSSTTRENESNNIALKPETRKEIYDVTKGGLKTLLVQDCVFNPVPISHRFRNRFLLSMAFISIWLDTVHPARLEKL